MQVCFQGLFIRACITQFILIPSLSLLASLPMISISETKHVFPWYQNNKAHFQNKRLFHFFFRFFIIFLNQRSEAQRSAQKQYAVGSWPLQVAEMPRYIMLSSDTPDKLHPVIASLASFIWAVAPLQFPPLKCKGESQSVGKPTDEIICPWRNQR